MNTNGESAGPLRTLEKPVSQRSTGELVSGITTDLTTLVRKEMELARLELTDALTARAKAAAAFAAAGLVALFGLLFLATAGAYALEGPLGEWLARVVVGCGFLVVAGVAVAFGAVCMKTPPMAPEETKRTIKEDVEWARAQLRR